MVNKKAEQQPGIGYVLEEAQAIIWPKSRLSSYEPGIYKFLTPVMDDDFRNSGGEEVSKGVIKITENDNAYLCFVKRGMAGFRRNDAGAER